MDNISKEKKESFGRTATRVVITELRQAWNDLHPAAKALALFTVGVGAVPILCNLSAIAAIKFYDYYQWITRP